MTGIQRRLSTEEVYMAQMQEKDEIKLMEQRGRLYDFYGPLLTGHQRQVYEAVVFDDYSLSEVAQEEGITRQGVHDIIRRCDRILEGYEEKLGLAEKFTRIQKLVEGTDLEDEILRIL